MGKSRYLSFDAYVWEYLWLYNHGKENIWHTNGMNVANSESTNIYGVKAVIKTKENLANMGYKIV